MNINQALDIVSQTHPGMGLTGDFQGMLKIHILAAQERIALAISAPVW